MITKDVKGMKHIGWYYELARYYDDEKEEYTNWEKCISLDKPNAGHGMRNVKKVYIKK